MQKPNGTAFILPLIDTGGIEPESQDVILSQMREQAQVASGYGRRHTFHSGRQRGIDYGRQRSGHDADAHGKRWILVVNKIDKPDKASR